MKKSEPPMDSNSGGAAFPLSAHPEHGYGAAASVNSGMTMREWYAGMALQGLCAANPKPLHGNWDPLVPEAAAEQAVAMADAVIKAIAAHARGKDGEGATDAL